MAEKWFTVEAVAALGGFKSVMSVYRRIWSGELEALDIRPRGGKKAQYRITESAWAQYARDHGIRTPERRAA